MQIKRLVIENFKSIERIELVEPNPFTVFVGPNGSGKSNIFEALEFANLTTHLPEDVVLSLFGGHDEVQRRQSKMRTHSFWLDGEDFEVIDDVLGLPSAGQTAGFLQFKNFARLFIGNERLVKLKITDNRRLTVSASNMETVLKRLLSDEIIRGEMYEWLELFIPGFKAVEVVDGSSSNKDTLLIYEQGVNQPFTRGLISDGTYSILTTLTAVYQSDDKPQFLCIEEPENGLHPQVARELVDFFRTMCEERGHYIWLNTHSPYMVSRVRPEELVVVDKVNGATQVKQFKGQEFDGMRMDEAWLTNALNGGKAW